MARYASLTRRAVLLGLIIAGPEDDLDPAVNSPVDPPPIHEEDEDDDPVDQPDEASDTDEEEDE